MKKLIHLLAFLVFSFCVFAGTYDNKRIQHGFFGSQAAIVPMADNGYLFASRMYGSVITKVNADGQVAWSKTIELPLHELLELYDAGTFADSGAYLIYLVSEIPHYYDVHFLIVRLDASGTVQWTTQLKFPNETSYLNNGRAKVLPDGSLVFSPRLTAQMAAVKLNPDGSLASSFNITSDTIGLDKNPSMDSEPTANGGMICIGKQEDDPVIVSIAPNGTADWTLYFSCEGYNRPYFVTRTSDGNYLVSGMRGGSMDYRMTAWLMKISPTGSILWAKTYSPADSLLQYDLHFSEVYENPDGSIVTLGQGSTYDYSIGSMVYTCVSAHLSSSGQVLSTYEWENPYYTFYDDHSLFMKSADGSMAINTLESDAFGITSSVFIKLSDVPAYCKASSIELQASPMPPVTHLPSSGVFVNRNLAIPTHPTLVTRDTVLMISSEDLCLNASTAIGELSSRPHISVVPNPAMASDIVTCHAADQEIGELYIYDIEGRLIKHVDQASFSVMGLLPGYYLIEGRIPESKSLGVSKLVVTE